METVELLDKYFATAFAAPDGIKRLRELILTLAMQGKLVPQNPQDRPASELLKEIEAEKKRLIKEKKIKKSKSLPEITPDEIPYDLPDSWKWVRFGYILDFQGGSQPPKRYFSERKLEGYVQLIQIRDLGTKPQPVYVPKDSVSKFCTNKDIMIGRYGASVGKVFWGKEGAYNVALIKLNNELKGYISEFLYLLMISPLGQNLFLGISRSAQDGFSKNDIAPKILPLPPLEEQHRIVKKIDRLMEQVDRLEKLKKERDRKQLIIHTAASDRLLNAPDKNSFNDAWNFIQNNFNELYSVKENISELRKAILQLAVMGKLVPQNPNDPPASELLKEIEAEKKRLIKEGKIKKQKSLPEIKPETIPYELPKIWIWTRLNDLLIFGPTNGFSPKAVEFETPVRSLTLSATTSGKFKGEYSKFIDHKIPLDSDLWLRDGDILIQRGNTLEYVGVSAIYRGHPNCYIYPDLMMKIRVSPKLDTEYINLSMSSKKCRDFLRERASGTSGTMPKINQKTLISLPIPLPPLPEQHRIVAKVDRLMALCDQLEAQLTNQTEKQTALLNEVIAAI